MKLQRVFVSTAIALLALSLQSHAQNVMDPSICQGSDFSSQDASSYFKPGSTEVSIGSYQSYAYQRICTHVSGCSDWTETSLYTHFFRPGSNVPQWVPIAQFGLKLSAESTAPYYAARFESQISTHGVNITSPLIDDSGFNISDIAINALDPRIGMYLYQGGAWTGSIKQHCAWYQWNATGPQAYPQWMEYQVVLYGSH